MTRAAELRARLSASPAGRYWAGKPVREQRVLAAVALLFVAALVINAVVVPIRAWHADAGARWSARLDDLAWMREHAGTVASGGAPAAPRVTAQSMLGIVSAAAASHRLTLGRMQPQGTDAVSVVLEDQSFEAVIRWLGELRETRALRVRQLALDSGTRPGRVNARLVIE